MKGRETNPQRNVLWIFLLSKDGQQLVLGKQGYLPARGEVGVPAGFLSVKRFV